MVFEEFPKKDESVLSYLRKREHTEIIYMDMLVDVTGVRCSLLNVPEDIQAVKTVLEARKPDQRVKEQIADMKFNWSVWDWIYQAAGIVNDKGEVLEPFLSFRGPMQTCPEYIEAMGRFICNFVPARGVGPDDLTDLVPEAIRKRFREALRGGERFCNDVVPTMPWLEELVRDTKERKR